MKGEVTDFSEHTFTTNEGVFTLVGAQYESGKVVLSDWQYMFVKLHISEMENKYSYGPKEGFSDLERNSKRFIRFEANGDGGVQIYAVTEDLRLVEIMEPVLLEGNKKYQVELPSFFSDKVIGLVIKNPAPEDTGTYSEISYVNIVDELDPKDQEAYFADALEWNNTLYNGDNGFDPYIITSSFGWSGLSGVSRGDMGYNDVAYIDSFGAALEYENFGSEANLSFAGCQIYGKFLVPEGTKKLTYWIGHVGSPSAYRIQLYYNGQFINLTESSTAVESSNVNLDEGWRLTVQDYNGKNTFEVAIPEEYVGKEVLVIVSAKFNKDSSFGVRVNNIAFSNEDVIVPATVVEGINIDSIDALEAINSGLIDFQAGNNGFININGVEFDSVMKLIGTTPLDDSEANAIAAAKILLGDYDYLRLFLNTEAGKSAKVRVRAIDLETKSITEISPWTNVSGEYVLQIQAFPSTFVGTVGLVIETKYIENCTVTVSKIDFANGSRDENGYDFDAMSYLTATEFPKDGLFTFTGDELAKWGIFTANDSSNTLGMLNNIWLQMQSTDHTGAYSVLAARKVDLYDCSGIKVKAGFIGSADLSGYIRVRTMLSDGTIINFTKEGLTDANGWFNVNSGSPDAGCDYGWGFLCTQMLDFDSGLAGKSVVLIVEYDKELSTSWNVLLESIEFVNPVTEKPAVEYEPGRNEEGYDYLTISELEETSLPENGYFSFDHAEVAKWTVLTANDASNTQALQNGTLLQLQATDTTGAYSVLVARCVTLADYTSVALKTAIIGTVGDSAYIRIRAMLSDNTIVTFTKEGLTDENGWFNSMTAAATNGYGWGPVDTVSLDVPEAVKGQTVKLIIEWDKEPSSNWNVLLESLTFTE